MITSGTGPTLIAPGDLGTLGTLTLGSSLTLNSNSTLSFDLSGSTSDLLALTGTLAASGLPALAVTATGTLAGDYTPGYLRFLRPHQRQLHLRSHPRRL